MARKLNINGTMKLQDEESFDPNVTKVVPFAQSMILDDDQLETVVDLEEGVGGEVRGVVNVRGQLLGDNKIRVSVDMWLYEGTSEATTDLDGEGHSIFFVSPNQTVGYKKTVWNTEENDEDYVRLKMTCKNLPA